MEEDTGGGESWGHDEESREGEAVEDAALVDAGLVEIRDAGSDGGLEIVEGVVRRLGLDLRVRAGRPGVTLFKGLRHSDDEGIARTENDRERGRRFGVTTVGGGETRFRSPRPGVAR